MDRNTILLIVIGLLVFLVIFNGGMGILNTPNVSGMRAEAGKLQLERDKLQRSVQNAEKEVARLDQIKKERATLEVQLREIAKRLPSERESAEVLRSVESLAGKSGLIVSGVKRRPVRQQELYIEIPLEVGVGGGYHDLVRFADQLAKLERLVALSEFTVQRPPAVAGGPGAPDGPVGTVKALLVAVVFQAIPAPQPAAPAAGAPAAAPKP